MSIRNNISDSMVMIKRSFHHNIQSPENLTIILVVPAVLMLMFVYIFGGAMNTGQNYIDFIVPGIMVLSITQCASMTALIMNNDIKQGIIDRFKSMPVYPPAILIGQTVTALFKVVVTAGVLLGVAFLNGLQVKSDFLQWLTILGLLLLYGLLITCIALFIGLISGSEESVSGYVFILTIFPYMSSAFAPSETMSGFVKWFVENQPLTHLIDSVRGLMAGTMPTESIQLTVIWLGLLLITFASLTLLAFKRKYKN